MITTSRYSDDMRKAILEPTRGVIGLVDDLLTLCRDHSLELNWRGDLCRIRSHGGDWEELVNLALPKSAFRSILARVAALCNERIPNSVSPYGGKGELHVGTEPEAIFQVAFVNTPDEQCLELL